MSKLKKRLVDNLPDAYDKSESSNNNKLFLIETSEMDKIRLDTTFLLDMLDLDKCDEKTLNLYGEMVGQPRGMATNSQYIRMIKAKIARNFVKSNYESIANAVVQTFNCSLDEYRLEETDEACVVKLTKLPLSSVIQSGLTANQATKLIKNLLPTGIKLESVNFEGTFEFSSAENETDDLAGFSDEEEIIGGYFGILESNIDEILLPI